MEEKKITSETGHADILAAAFVAAVCAILLVIGANRDSSMMVWIGGIGLAAGILGQFWFTHSAITGILGRLDELEKNKAM